MTALQSQKRPWYVNNRLCDDYVAVAQRGGDFRMLKGLKILRSMIVNLGIIAIALVSILEADANATIVGSAAIVTIGLYGGVELADYAALAQAFAEVKSDDGDQS